MKILFGLFLVTTTLWASGQEPVQWTYSARRIDDKSYEIHFVATIQSPWHTYSQFTPDGGPLATKITINRNPLAKPDGPIKEIGKLEEYHEEIFGVDVKQFSGKVDFVQVVKLKAKVKTKLSGSITYMACNNQQCLPPKTINFSVNLP